MFSAVCSAGCKSQYSILGISSRNCCALEVECDASSPGQMEAAVSNDAKTTGLVQKAIERRA
jgi:hypothetical protein